jgi:deazaflavin-dependent oxidoreductase (nitroreductase family)
MESQSQLGDIADESFCYLTTTGRNTGGAHTIEIWFAVYGDSVYLLSGGRERADWVRNILRTPEVTVRISNREFRGRGRIVTEPDEDRRARGLVADKYQPSYGGDLSTWRRGALPVAIDLTPPHI